MENRVGQQLGNYKLEKLLGEGGFAEVYLAEHIFLKHKKAIKILRTYLSKQESTSFRKEALRLAQLTHPHIIPILDFDEREGFPYLVMEYAPKGSLRDRYPKGSRIPLLDIVNYVKQVASALQYLHDQKLIHRDVKPENMLLGQDNKVFLSDVGIAVVAHSEYSQRTQHVTGTPNYMAPEQFRGKAEPASDQYSLGVIVYEWISGSLPFSQGDPLQLGYQHAYEQPPPLHTMTSTISIDIEKVVMIALNKKPQERFMNILNFADSLEKAIQTKAPEQPISRQQSNLRRRQRLIQPMPATLPLKQAQVPIFLQPTPVQAINKDALYREGVVAESKGNLEQTAALWQQILDQDPRYGNGVLRTQMKKLREKIRQQQIEQLRQQALDAQKVKAFEQEMTAWQELKKLLPGDIQANDRLGKLDGIRFKSRIEIFVQQVREASDKGDWTLEIEVLTELSKLLTESNKLLTKSRELRYFLNPAITRRIQLSMQEARNNQRFVWMYENAIQFVQDGNNQAARTLLNNLWELAPTYGDPANLANSIGIDIPQRSKFNL